MPTPSFVLRSATAADAESIAALHTDSWRRTYRGMMTDAFLDGGALENRRSVWADRLGRPNPSQFVCLAEDADRLAGFICVFANEDPVWGSYIDNLHVAPGLHRRGLGRSLMRRAAGWLCDAGAQGGLYLWVMEANANARAFYDRLGATNAGTEMHEDPGGGRAPNCRYTWSSARLLLG